MHWCVHHLKDSIGHLLSHCRPHEHVMGKRPQQVSAGLNQFAMLDDGDLPPRRQGRLLCQNGKDPNRVKASGCAKRCKVGLHFKAVLHLVITFWSLSKGALLHRMYFSGPCSSRLHLLQLMSSSKLARTSSSCSSVQESK